MMPSLTIARIKEIVSRLADKGANSATIDQIANTLHANQDKFKNEQEILLFVGQCAHETAGFKSFREKYNGDPVVYFNGLYGPGTKNGKDFGHTKNEDAYDYCGRGLLQITGKNNYLKYAKQLGAEKYKRISTDPSVLERDISLGAEMSIQYWLDRVQPSLTFSTAEDLFNQSTKGINPNELISTDAKVKERLANRKKIILKALALNTLILITSQESSMPGGTLSADVSLMPTLPTFPTLPYGNETFQPVTIAREKFNKVAESKFLQGITLTINKYGNPEIRVDILKNPLAAAALVGFTLAINYLRYCSLPDATKALLQLDTAMGNLKSSTNHYWDSSTLFTRVSWDDLNQRRIKEVETALSNLKKLVPNDTQLIDAMEWALKNDRKNLLLDWPRNLESIVKRYEHYRYLPLPAEIPRDLPPVVDGLVGLPPAPGY